MFQIHTRVDYGLILLRSLANQGRTKPLSLKVIAADNGLPYRYLASIASALRRARIIESFEGVNGGYRLKRKPETIALNEIAKILTPYKKLNRCLVSDDHATCKLKKTCAMSPWWFKFNHKVEALLQKIKLSDLL